MVVSAGLVVLTFPPFGISYLALVAWIPLLWALKDASLAAGTHLGFLHGMLSFAGTLCWLWGLFGPLSIGLWAVLALFSAVFGLSVAMAQKCLKNRLHLLAVIPVLWAGIEYFRCEVFTLHFPWITPGTGFEPNLFTGIVGVYGVSLVLIWAGGSLALGGRTGRITGALALVLMVFPLSRLDWARDIQKAEVDGNVSVAIVQSEECYFRAYADLSETISEPVDAILWPEYAVSNDLMTSPVDLARTMALMRSKSASILVTGSRTNLENGDYYNTALTVGLNGELGRHFKNRPVHFFKDGQPGTESAVIETPIGKIGTPICFDCDYGEVVRNAVLGGAEILLVPSMDAISWGERQHLQHAELFKHRAAENGRWMAVAATSGRSQVIAPWGDVVDELPLMDPGILHGMVRIRSELTPYTTGGWLVGPIMMWSAAGIFVGLSIAMIRAKKCEVSIAHEAVAGRD